MVLENQYTRRLKTILQSRYLFKILVVLFITYALIYTNLHIYTSKYNKNTTTITGTITKYTIGENKITIYIKAKETIIATYYQNENKYNYELGDKLKLIGVLEKPNKNTLPNTFNYQKYLYYNKIYYIMNVSNIKKISNNTSILYYLKNKIKNHIDKIDKTGYINIFILGDKKYIDKEMLNNYQENGVSHLFSISGMHISLIASIILYLLKKISYNNKLNYTIVILFLLFYLFLTNYSPSILRATIMFILLAINKTYNLKIKSIDIILIVLIIVIIINPLYIYNIGFQFSYLISFTLILLSNKIKIIKNKLKQSLYISFVCFLVSLPISIYNFYQVNILSIFLNILLIPLISVIIYPLSLITFIIPILSPILNFFINILETLNKIISNINILKIILCKINIPIIIIYYIVIYLSLYNKKNLITLIIIFIIHKNYLYLDNKTLITYIDVGQGDSTLIKFPNKKLSILIDTGGIVSYNNKKIYSITENKTILYLKSLGISYLNYLILTHGDYDHMAKAINLVNNFRVEKVIFNCGPYNDLEKELIKVLDKKKIKYYSCISELKLDKNKLFFLQTKEYDNENDNSNVIYTELNGYKFMFMGDASTNTEKEILSKYNLPDIDVLKVGHHGSKTSSSKEFIDKINPEHSIISVGKNNRYGHPNKEVLENLNNSKTYRTDEEGSIMFKIKNNKLKIETCSP